MPHPSDGLVRSALWCNVVFTTLAGLALLFAGGVLGELFAVPALALRVVGAGLLPFAVSVALAARRAEVRPAEVRVISALDAGWVVGSVGLYLLWPSVMNATGWAVAVIIALFVGSFSVAQALGVRRLRPSVSAALV